MQEIFVYRIHRNELLVHKTKLILSFTFNLTFIAFISLQSWQHVISKIQEWCQRKTVSETMLIIIYI
jgi:hypothetical protein